MVAFIKLSFLVPRFINTHARAVTFKRHRIFDSNIKLILLIWHNVFNDIWHLYYELQSIAITNIILSIACTLLLKVACIGYYTIINENNVICQLNMLTESPVFLHIYVSCLNFAIHFTYIIIVMYIVQKVYRIFTGFTRLLYTFLKWPNIYYAYTYHTHAHTNTSNICI